MKPFQAENATVASPVKGFLELPCDMTLDVVFWAVNSVLAVVILLGNTLACVVFLRTRHLRNSFMNIYLVSLAISDIGMALVVIPLYAVFCSGCSYSLTPYCWIIRVGKDIVFGANILNLMAITFDRHEAFFNPLRYSAKMTKQKVTMALSAVWGIPFLVTAARNIWQHRPSQDALHVDKIYSIVLVFVFVLIPLFFLLVMNSRILYIIHKQNKQIQAVCTNKIFLSVQTRQNGIRNARKLRGTLACVAVVLVYIICWLPRIFYNFCALFRSTDLVSPTLVQLSLFFLFLQSSLNPFIYSFYRLDFRQAAFLMIRCQDPSAGASLSRFTATT